MPKQLREKVILDKEDLKDMLATVLPAMVGAEQKGPLSIQEVDQILLLVIGMFYDDETAQEIEELAVRIEEDIKELGSPMQH